MSARRTGSHPRLVTAIASAALLTAIAVTGSVPAVAKKHKPPSCKAKQEQTGCSLKAHAIWTNTKGDPDGKLEANNPGFVGGVKNDLVVSFRAGPCPSEPVEVFGADVTSKTRIKIGKAQTFRGTFDDRNNPVNGYTPKTISNLTVTAKAKTATVTGSIRVDATPTPGSSNPPLTCTRPVSLTLKRTT